MKSLLAKNFSNFLQIFTQTNVRLSFLVLLFIVGSSTVFLALNKVGITYNYKLGDIAKDNVRVPWDIQYKKESETKKAKRRAELAVPLVFDMNRYVLVEKIQNIDELFTEIDSVMSDESYYALEHKAVKIKVVEQNLSDENSYSTQVINAIISYKHREELRNITVRILNDIFKQGILAEPYSNPLNLEKTDTAMRVISDNGEYLEERRDLSSITSLPELEKDLNTVCTSYTSDLPKNQSWAIYLIVKQQIVQNTQFNLEETKRRMKKASDSVEPVMGILKKNHILVREGEPVTSDSLKLITILNTYTSKINKKYIFGVFLFQLVFLLILFFFVTDIRDLIMHDSRAVLVSTILLFSFFIYASIVNRTVDYLNANLLFAFYLPLTFVTMIITILFSAYLAMICSLYILFFTITLTGGDYATIIISFSSCFLGIFAVKTLEKRIDFIKIGAIIGVANSFLVFAIGFIREYTNDAIYSNIRLSLASGVVNTIAVMGLFPLFEHFFGLTTKFKLYELTDLNAPIFKEMLIKAPGTYNHSILVANMAEGACKAIGADALLARVGSYYHDIGKIENSKIFTENKQANVRINLSAREYSRRIINHVHRGVEIAKKLKLPREIIKFITEHHGDSTVTFFYHQALELAEKRKVKTGVDEKDFRYPGPKPHSKETAIVMLADAIEAASRSLQDPSEEKLEELVNKIVTNRLNGGDLEQSNMTLHEISSVKKAFVTVLTGVFHSRIEYPEQSEIKKLEKKVNSIAEKSSSRSTKRVKKAKSVKKSSRKRAET